MKINMLSRFLILICLVSIYLNVGCSSLISASKTEVPQSQVQKLNEQIVSGQYRQIYKESSEVLQAGIPEDLFVKRLNEAVEKMRAVDETLRFQKSETDDVLSKLLNGEFWTNSFQKVEKDNKRLEFLTQWTKSTENDSFELRSLSVIEPTESGKSSIYVVEQDKVLTE